MSELMIAIAALCSTPTANRLGTNEVLACQKYYVNCTMAKNSLPNRAADRLPSCVLAKAYLGGPK